MMHAENGIAIDVLIEQALARGETDPRYHGVVRHELLEAEATHRAIKLAQVASAPRLHRAPVGARRRWRRSRRRATRATTRSPRPARSTCSCPPTTSPGPDFEGAKYVCSTPLRPSEHQAALWRGLRTERPVGGLHRPLPVLLQGPEGDGPRRLLQDPQRAAGRRAPDGPAAPGRASTGTSRGGAGSRSPARRRRGCSGSTRARARSRPGADADVVDLRPAREAGVLGGDAPHERRLLLLRGQGDHRQGRDGALPRAGRDRRRGVPRARRGTAGS